ncbi:MAG TPA: phosphatidate cytidylyltransferase [Phycisphaerae bacterium]|nr:phosphatidate cytidylyltransferase [Phycisphaerae bacterium]
MSDTQTGNTILGLTAAILGGFGLVVLVGAIAARARGASPRSMVRKYLAWFLITPPILLPLVYSRVLFQVVILLVSLQCIREYARVTGLWSDRGVVRLCYALTLAMYVPIFAGWYGAHQAGPVLAVALLMLVPIVRGRYEHMLQTVSLSILAVVYFGWFMSHLAYLPNLRHGVAWAFYLIVLVVCNDALGYLWGTWLGRHKLIPRISPNKTIEGAALGAASVLAVGWLVRGLLPAGGTALALGLAAMIAALGTCGDLAVSFIKRDVRVKDTGAAIPGHGGVLDRCDSLMLAAPVFFHAVRNLA